MSIIDYDSGTQAEGTATMLQYECLKAVRKRAKMRPYLSLKSLSQRRFMSLLPTVCLSKTNHMARPSVGKVGKYILHTERTVIIWG